MIMGWEALSNTIINKINEAIGKDGSQYNNNTAYSAMSAVSNAITEYLIANTTVYISYTGVLSNATAGPDPVINDTFKIIGKCAPTPPANNFDDWIVKLQSNIISGFTLAPIGAAGVVFQKNPFINKGIGITQTKLKLLHNVNDTDPANKIWGIISQAIISWINNTAIDTTSGTATRPSAPSAGTATILEISLL